MILKIRKAATPDTYDTPSGWIIIPDIQEVQYIRNSIKPGESPKFIMEGGRVELFDSGDWIRADQEGLMKFSYWYTHIIAKYGGEWETFLTDRAAWLCNDKGETAERIGENWGVGYEDQKVLERLEKKD